MECIKENWDEMNEEKYSKIKPNFIQPVYFIMLIKIKNKSKTVKSNQCFRL